MNFLTSRSSRQGKGQGSGNIIFETMRDFIKIVYKKGYQLIVDHILPCKSDKIKNDLKINKSLTQACLVLVHKYKDSINCSELLLVKYDGQCYEIEG